MFSAHGQTQIQFKSKQRLKLEIVKFALQFQTYPVGWKLLRLVFFVFVFLSTFNTIASSSGLKHEIPCFDHSFIPSLLLGPKRTIDS